ncbi:MAG: YfhO family protein [bacterium]|nr:YfhO family protein [bacterium]
MGRVKRAKKLPIAGPKAISESTLNKILITILFVLPIIYFAPFLSGSKMLYGSDWLLGAYSSMKWVADCIKANGSAPLWNPAVFCGLPAGNPYTFYTLLTLVLPVHVVWTYLFVFGTFLAGLGMYLYLKELKLSLSPCFIGALVYMGCGSVLSMTYPGHEGKIMAAGLFPFILLFLHKGLAEHRLVYFLFAGGVGGFAATHAHFQLIYYAGIVCIFYLLYHLIWQRNENKLKGSLRLMSYSVAGLVLAGGLLAINYLPIFAGIGWGARGEGRGYEFATSWALPPNELLGLLTPHFSGILDNYWGENYFKLDTQYIGIVPLLLAVVAMVFRSREKYVKFFIGLAVVATVFAVGGHTPLYRIPYHILPGIKKFRGPSMIFFLGAFSIAVLLGFGIQLFIENQKAIVKSKKLKKLGLLLGIIFGIVVIFSLICSLGKESVLSFLKEHFQPVLLASYGPGLTQQKLQTIVQNYPYFIGGLGRTIFLIAVNSILIILLATKKLKLVPWTIVSAVILLFDQWSIEKKFLKSVPHPKEYYKADEVVNFLSSTGSQPVDNSLYRVFPVYYEHSTDGYLPLHNIQSVGGYVPNPGERYQKLIGAGESVMFNAPNLMRYRNIVDILNVKYIVSLWVPDDISGYPENIQKAIEDFKLSFFKKWGISWTEVRNRLKLVYRDARGYAVYENENALPRVWITHNFKVVPREQVLKELKSTEFDPRTIVLIEEEPSTIQNLELRIQNSEKVKIVGYTPNKITIETELEAPGFLVLSENWHSDWKVYVDGKESKLYVADYALRAVQLDEGEHKVEFIYDSPYFKIGATLSFISFLFLLGVIGFWVRTRKRSQ